MYLGEPKRRRWILLALGVGGPAGYAAAVLYAVLNSLNKGVLFLATGLRGPLMGAAFAVGAFSVCGVPPVAGFLGKLAVFEAAVTQRTPVSVTLVVLVFLGSALSFLYAFQVYQRSFLKPEVELEPSSPLLARLLVVSLAGFCCCSGSGRNRWCP